LAGPRNFVDIWTGTCKLARHSLPTLKYVYDDFRPREGEQPARKSVAKILARHSLPTLKYVYDDFFHPIIIVLLL
jgi:hypothetical protein